MGKINRVNEVVPNPIPQYICAECKGHVYASHKEQKLELLPKSCRCENPKV